MSLDCGYECFLIGGPWIAENPNCPVHGSNKRAEEAVEESVLVILCQVYSRSISADDALIELQELLNF